MYVHWFWFENQPSKHALFSLNFPICPAIHGSGPSSSSDVETDDHKTDLSRNKIDYIQVRKKLAWLDRKSVDWAGDKLDVAWPDGGAVSEKRRVATNVSLSITNANQTITVLGYIYSDHSRINSINIWFCRVLTNQLLVDLNGPSNPVLRSPSGQLSVSR